MHRLTSGEAEVQLLSCTGEPVDRLSSAEPEVLQYLTVRPSSEHPISEREIT